MYVTGLDNKHYVWNPAKKQAKVKDENKSSLHKKAKRLLKEVYPFDRILEEVKLPGTRTTRRRSSLAADFFIPNRTLMIEVHGEQHYTYNSFFFKNSMEFYKAQARDRDKIRWCEINDIGFIELPFDESEDEWRKKLE